MLEQLQNVVVLASRTNCRLTSSAVSSGMRLPSEQRLAQQWFSTLAPNRSASHAHSTCVAKIPAPSTTAFHASPSTVGQRCMRNPAMTVCLALTAYSMQVEHHCRLCCSGCNLAAWGNCEHSTKCQVDVSHEGERLLTRTFRGLKFELILWFRAPFLPAFFFATLNAGTATWVNSFNCEEMPVLCDSLS